jgi:hypothetical protein
MHSAVPVGVIIFYILLETVIGYAASRGTFSSFPFIAWILTAILVLFLVRMVSTRYILDAEKFHAWRLFGSRSVALDNVRKIESGNLRDLGPVSFLGGWGWRGRMWSPVIGPFDAIYTISRGLLVTADRVPVFISPKDPARFARELSRRVRSYAGPLEVDVGHDDVG